MPEIKGTIEIGRPVEDVFAYVTDSKNTQEWESGVEEELTSEGPMGIGSKGRRVETFMGRDESIWEVTEWKPGERWSAKFESDKFIGEGGLRTESTDSGTRLTYRFEGRAKNPVFKLLMPFFMPMIRRKIKKDYQRLKGILES